MMLITMDGCYLVDRNFNFRRVQMRFPCKHTNEVWMHLLLGRLMIWGRLHVEHPSQVRVTFFLYFLACKGLAEKTHHYTLLDGEMIIDTVPDSQKQERRYLIYDMMAINHVPIIEVSLPFFCAFSSGLSTSLTFVG